MPYKEWHDVNWRGYLIRIHFSNNMLVRLHSWESFNAKGERIDKGSSNQQPEEVIAYAKQHIIGYEKWLLLKYVEAIEEERKDRY